MISYEHMHDRSFRNQAFNELQENNGREQDRSMNVMSSRLTSVHVEILMLALVYSVEYRVVFYIFHLLSSKSETVLCWIFFLSSKIQNIVQIRCFQFATFLWKDHHPKFMFVLYVWIFTCVRVCFLRSLPNYKFQIQRNHRQKADFCHQQNK